MKFAEFRVYVQVDETHDRTLSSMREFIRTCIESLDGVSAVEVEPPRGSMAEPDEPGILTEPMTH